MLKNVTLKIDKNILKKGQHTAIEEGKSLSKWVSELIEQKTNNLEQINKSKKRAIKIIDKGLKLPSSNFSRKSIYE